MRGQVCLWMRRVVNSACLFATSRYHFDFPIFFLHKVCLICLTVNRRYTSIRNSGLKIHSFLLQVLLDRTLEMLPLEANSTCGAPSIQRGAIFLQRWHFRCNKKRQHIPFIPRFARTSQQRRLLRRFTIAHGKDQRLCWVKLGSKIDNKRCGASVVCWWTNMLCTLHW